jgi:hypothetical protein
MTPLKHPKSSMTLSASSETAILAFHTLKNHSNILKNDRTVHLEGTSQQNLLKNHGTQH